MVLAKQNTICPFIYSLKTMEDLLLVHHLMTRDKVLQLQGKLNELQVEIDQIRYTSSEVGTTGPAPDISGGRWEMTDLKSWHSSVQHHSTQPLPTRWRRELDWSVSKVLALINSTVQYTAHKVYSAYWRLDPVLGILYKVNIEVRPRNKRPVMAQAHLQLPLLYTAPTPAPTLPSLTIVTIVSDGYYKELKSFVRMMQNVNSQHNMQISLVFVRMGYIILTEVDHFLSSLHRHLTDITVNIINDIQWTSRSVGVALALQHVGRDNVVLLGDLQLQLNCTFLQRCVTYPVQGASLYVPYILVHSYSHYWEDAISVVCVWGRDLLAVTTGVHSVVNVHHVVKNLMARGLNVLRGADDGLLWVQEGGDCAGALVGESCEGDDGEKRKKHVIAQHSQLMMKKPLRY